MRPVHPMCPCLRRGRRGAHLGRRRPWCGRARHHRPQPALGRVADMHVMRQVRPGLPDRGTVPPGLDRRGDGTRQAAAAVSPHGPGEEGMERLKIATTWLGGCSGCHMSFLDLDEWLIELARRADIVYSPVIDAKE